MLLFKRWFLLDYLRAGFLCKFKFFFLLSMHYLSLEHFVFIQNFFWKFYFIKFFRIKKSFLSKVFLDIGFSSYIRVCTHTFLGFFSRGCSDHNAFLPSTIYSVGSFQPFIDQFTELLLTNQYVFFYFFKLNNIVYDLGRFESCFSSYFFEYQHFLGMLFGLCNQVVRMLASLVLKFYFFQNYYFNLIKAGIA